MREVSKFGRGRMAAVVAAVLVTGVVAAWSTVWAGTQPPAAGRAGSAGFLREGRCYRLTFAIAGTPDWKVLEVLDGGWILAEPDAGSSSARRESAWINTAQVVTVREKTCAP
jgi:hypothetical protein